MRKPIAGYEGFYDIDDKGRVYSIERWVTGRHGPQFVPSCERKLSEHGTGYLTVRLAKNGIIKTHRVHRLVAIAFIPNPHNLPDINHIDGNKHNNTILQENGKPQLEWCNALGNMQHAAENNLTAKSERNSGAKLSAIQINDAFDRCMKGEPVAVVAASLDVNRNALRLAFRRCGFQAAWDADLPNRRRRAASVRWQNAK